MRDKSAYTLNSKSVNTLFGAGLILLGVLFLIGQFVGGQFDFDIGHYAWPFYIIIPGLLVFAASFAFEPQEGITVAVIGGIVSMTGAILLFQNTFDLFASWAYAWALVAPASIGLTKLVYGALRGLKNQVKSGLKLAGVGLAIFIFGGFFFELVIGISGFGFGIAWLFWPVLLIALGVVLLLFNLLPRRDQHSA